MDSALACHPGGRGSIPTVGIDFKSLIQMIFSLSGIGVRKKQIEPRHVEMVLLRVQ